MTAKTKKKGKQKLIYKKIIFFVVVLVVLTGLITSLKQIPPNTNKEAVLVSAAPQKVKITNVFSQGFSVTWLTTEKTPGAIIYGRDRQAIEGQDIAGNLQLKKTEENLDPNGAYIHCVKIDNLKPKSTYYFKIISGEKTFFKSISDSWQETGVAEEINLPAKPDFSPSYFISPNNSPGSYSLESKAFAACQTEQNREVSSCFRPNPIYGQVVDDKQSPVNAALVFLEIPGKSNLLSVLTGPEGKWVFDLANLLKIDFSGPLGYDPKTDLVKITVVSGTNQSISNYFSIPSVVDIFKNINNLIKLKT